MIGRHTHNVTTAEARTSILGYTCANDVTARDLQKVDGQWTRAKGFDTFCPLGPWIETEVDPTDLAVECFVDGERRQSGRTSDMIFDPFEIVLVREQRDDAAARRRRPHRHAVGHPRRWTAATSSRSASRASASLRNRLV